MRPNDYSRTARSGVVVAVLVALVAIWSAPAAGAASSVKPGTRVWSVVSENPGLRDSPTAMAVSPNGSRVFVAGMYDDGGGGTQSGYEVRAYNAATGDEIWSTSFTGTTSQGQASSVAVSPDSSRVYVTGRNSDQDVGYVFTTFAYAARSGARLWVARYVAGTASGVPSLAVGPEGSRLYVTGTVRDPIQNDQLDAATIAYDAKDGTRIWVSLYHGSLSSEDMIPSAITVGPKGDRVYVTGQLMMGNADYGTIAYDSPTGTRLWVATYDDPAHGWDNPLAVAVSPNGSRVFVTGIANSSNEGASDYATVAYSARGARLWAARYDGPAGGDDLTAPSLAISPDGSRLFVTGRSRGALTVAWATLAYATTSGTRLWTARYDGPTHAGAGAAALGVSPDGTRVYVTGSTTGSTGTSIVATRAYSTAYGAALWTSRYPALGKGALAEAVAIGPGGARVFVTAEVVAGSFVDSSGSLETDWDFGTVAFAA